MTGEDKGEGKRDDFLIAMYNQMFNDINTHILVVWQSAGVVVAAFAIFALAEKQIVSFDVATTLVILTAAWLLFHLHDAGYWYNRNLAIIANIERQFLRHEDQMQIHYYWGLHRTTKNKMIDHLRIQYGFGVGIAAILIGVHFWTRVKPGIGSAWSTFDPMRALPYAVAGVAGWKLIEFRDRLTAKYKEFVENSPGKAVDTSGIKFGGIGHPVDVPEKSPEGPATGSAPVKPSAPKKP